MPIKKLTIFQDDGQEVKDVAGPFNEGTLVNLTCVTEGGK